MRKLNIIGTATALALFSLGGAHAQMPATPAAPPPAVQAQPGAPMQSPMGMQRPAMPTDQQIVDAVNARLATLKANLRLTPEQQGHWGQLETAMRETTVIRTKQRLERQAAMAGQREAFREQMRKWRDEQRSRTDGVRSDPPPRPGQMSDLESMKMQAQMMAMRATEIQRIADAAAPLYATLDEGQRRRLMDGMRRAGEQAMGGGDRGGDRGMGRWRDNDGEQGGGRRWGRDWRN